MTLPAVRETWKRRAVGVVGVCPPAGMAVSRSCAASCRFRSLQTTLPDCESSALVRLLSSSCAFRVLEAVRRSPAPPWRLTGIELPL